MLNESNIPLEEDGIEEEILVDEEVAITKAMWGDVGGNIENQTDLQNALDAKQDNLTEAQLNAVNSGITSEKVTTYDGYADQIASKADQSALNAESTARGEADTALGTRIDNEVLARQQADNGLQSQIDAITSKSDVVDVVANYAALQAYDTSTLGNNDVVKVLDDETHEDALTYYRWSTTTQTWTYIGQEAPYYSKGQMDVKLAEKQDKLTAGANIQIQNGTISATDTTYTAGNGLNLNGTEFSADTDVLATKEDLEGYYTKPETDNLLAPKLESEVVAELPTTGAEGKLYLTPKAHTTSTATGNPIEATITAQAGQLESFQLDGDTFQQTYTGKNLYYDTDGYNQGFLGNNGEIALSAESVTNVTYIEASENTQYVMSFNDLYGGITFRGIAFYDSNKNFISRAQPSHNNSFTTPQNTAYIRVYFYNANGLDATNFPTNYISDIQLELGSTATSFEPFVGGQPSPNPDYPQQIQTVTGEQTVEIVGKNLFDKDNYNILNCWPTSVLAHGNNWSIWIPCEPNTTYSVTKMICQPTGNNRFRIATTAVEPDYNVAVVDAVNPGTNNTTGQITTGATAKYLMVVLANTDTVPTTTLSEMLGSVQIERGPATAYAPYSKQTLPIDLGTIELCKLATYQDYIWKDGGDWKVHKATGSASASNREWEWANMSPNGWYFSRTNYGYYDTNKINVISKSFIGVKRPVAPNTSGAFITMAGDGSIGIRNPNITGSSNVTQFTNWLNSLNTTLLYALTTPTDTTITDATLIAQLEAIRTANLENGTNTITNTATGSNLAGDMEIGYYGFNPTNRYDKFIWLDLNNNYEQIGGE